ALDPSLRNGRRIGIVPIVNPLYTDGVANVVMGFARVFLPPDQDQGGGHSLCAEYIGPATGFGFDPGAGQSSSVYSVRLVQ
ncbi:MAG: hypothetical protein ACRD96_07530, partial [Bryobacteraceae bacterium]